MSIGIILQLVELFLILCILIALIKHDNINIYNKYKNKYLMIKKKYKFKLQTFINKIKLKIMNRKK